MDGVAAMHFPKCKFERTGSDYKDMRCLCVAVDVVAHIVKCWRIELRT